MNHIPDTGKMVETPRTDEREAHNGNVLCGSANLDFARQLERELNAANERIRLLIAERDSARQQADLSWKLREEFTALIGTDDVEEGVAKVKLMKAALECAVAGCEHLHHKKAHQHARGEKCIPEELIRMAKRISTTQTK